jgi:hypothetical protein
MRLEALVKDHRDIFEFIYTNNQKKWERLLEVFYRNKDFEDNKLKYFVSLPLQRNPYYSDIYNFYCSVLMIRVLVDNGLRLDRIEVDFPFQRKIICNFLVLENIQNIRIYSSYGHIRAYFNGLLVNSIDLLKFVYKSISIFRLKWYNNKRNYKFNMNSSYIFLESYGSADFIKRRLFIDRNHGNEFVNELKQKYGDRLVIIPDLEFRKLNSNDLNWYFNFQGAQILLKCDFIKLFDFFTIVKFGVTKKLRFQNAVIDNIDLTLYFSFENNCNSWSSLYHLYNYFFYRRISNCCDVSLFYDWWENQPIDKITLYSLNKFFTNCQRIGVISYMIDCNYNFYLKPTTLERKYKLSPDEFHVWSLKYADFLNLKVDGISIVKLDFNRYRLISNKEIFNPVNKRIIVLLPSILNEAAFILETIFSSYSEFVLMGYDLNVKCHPNLNLKSDKFERLLNFIDPTVAEVENNYSIVISSVSSAIVESIFLGKFVIILSDSSFIQSPGMLDIKTLSKASNFYELKSRLVTFADLDWLSVKSDIKKLKDEYFK